MEELQPLADRPTDLNDLPLSVVMRIDQLADDFEHAWRSGQQPRLDDYVAQLSSAGDDAQAALDAHLTALQDDLEGSVVSRESTLPAETGQTPHIDGAMTTPKRMIPEQGVVEVGEYRLVEPLGTGGMGVVYKALHTRLDCFVAIKFPRYVDTVDRLATTRFLREAKLIGRLKHANIVRALDAGDSLYGPYLVTEYVEGDTIESHIQQSGPQSFDNALLLTLQAAGGLAYAHSQGIIHRDIKPANLLLDADGTVRVVDFGLAKMQFGDSASGANAQSAESTQFGAFLGTVGYAAPEQLRPEEDVDHRADIYALGCVLYYLLEGSPPHAGSLADRLRAERKRSTATLGLPSCEMPPGFVKLWRRMVANTPHRRIASMNELIEALDASLSEWREGRRRRVLSRRKWLATSALGVGGSFIALKAIDWAGADKLGEPGPNRFRPTGRPPPMATAPFNTAEAKRHQQRWAKYLSAPVRLVNSIDLAMVLIPAGDFMMGLDEAPLPTPLPGEADWRYKPMDVIRQEQFPRHRVELTKAIYFGETEVTFAQFRQFVDATDYVTDAEKNEGWGKEDRGWLNRPGYSWKNTGQWVSTDDHPVMNVTYNDAVAFCEWLSQHDPLGKYRLPTEAEWEFACRAGTTTLFYFGNEVEPFPDHAWCKLNFEGQFHPVGLKLPNPFGLHDVYGNRQEWCQDNFSEQFYAESPLRDPVCETGGPNRILRGGTHSDVPAFCTSARRWYQADTSVGAAGIRVVCEVY